MHDSLVDIGAPDMLTVASVRKLLIAPATGGAATHDITCVSHMHCLTQHIVSIEMMQPIKVTLSELKLSFHPCQSAQQVLKSTLPCVIVPKKRKLNNENHHENNN